MPIARKPFPRTSLSLAIAAACVCQGAFAAEPQLRTITVVGRYDVEGVRQTGDAARLLERQGVNFYSAGGASSLPVLRGLADERINVLVDGAPGTSACANHMNPPLSYVDASQIERVEVMAGITPVSRGGDSIGGTISVDTASPKYAADGRSLYSEASLSAFYRSVSEATGYAASAVLADDRFSIGYAGAYDRAQSYEDGNGDKVLDTLYQTENHNLTFGARGDRRALVIKLGHQDIPYQGYPNQYMDMVGNRSDAINVRYTHELGRVDVDARLFWRDTRHEMGFFTREKNGSMPMKTEGEDIGYALRGDIALSREQTLRVGHDFHRISLDDWWPALPGSTMMGPLDYVNINDGRRERFGLFVESEYRWSAEWTSLLGLRGDHVRMNTGDVQPYDTQNPIPMGGMGGGMGGGMSMGMANPDAPAAVAFNALDRKRDDTHIDLTALLGYEPAKTARYEFGYARKSRSPSLYERYSWGRGTMAMTMIGWFGDANGYVGNPDLDPETAHTVSATLDWHDAAQRKWQLKATPYYTYVDDYIDVDRIGTFNPLVAMQETRPLLRFANRDAVLYGIDIAGQVAVWSDTRFGHGVLSGVVGYTWSERRDNGDSLYHVMPLNAKLTLAQQKGQWVNAVDVELVARKSRVQTLRLEQESAGYALVDLRTSYTWSRLRIDAGIRNLFDRHYEQPLGGASYAAWKHEGSSGPIGSIPGPGRSYELGATLMF